MSGELLAAKSAVGVAHSSAICMFARAGAAGATRDGAWKDCTKVVARTCHSSQERKASAEGRSVAALTARERSRGSSVRPPSFPVCSRAASAAGECRGARERTNLHV